MNISLQLKGFVDSLQQAADVEKEAFLTQHADSYIALYVNWPIGAERPLWMN